MPNSLFMFSYNFPATLVRDCTPFCTGLDAFCTAFFLVEGSALFFLVFRLTFCDEGPFFLSRSLKKFEKFFWASLIGIRKNLKNFFEFLEKNVQRGKGKTEKKRPRPKKKPGKMADKTGQNSGQNRTSVAGKLYENIKSEFGNSDAVF